MRVATPTIFVGVYGQFRPYPWLGPAEHDAYSVFVERAVAMGWTSTGPNGLGPALWGMNDAGQEWTDPRPTRIAWYQVDVMDAVAAGRPLPVQPLVACAVESLQRVGSVDLSALSLLLPVGASGPALPHLVSGLGWFGTADPAARTAVRLTVDPGDDDAVRPVAADVLRALRGTNTGPFRIEAVLPDGPAVDPRPAVVGDLWLGARRHPVTFACSVPEWTGDALGWLTAVVGAACREAGVRTTALISTERA